MFRLVKTLNNTNFVIEPVKLPIGTLSGYGKGCPVMLTSGNATKVATTDKPAFMTLESSDDAKDGMITCYQVTDCMVFLVEYRSSSIPRVGSRVTFSSGKYPMDSVIYNTTGKGIIVGVTENPKLVYVQYK